MMMMMMLNVIAPAAVEPVLRDAKVQLNENVNKINKNELKIKSANALGDVSFTQRHGFKIVSQSVARGLTSLACVEPGRNWGAREPPFVYHLEAKV